MDSDKTIVIDTTSQEPEYEICPVCKSILEFDPECAELLRCPACNYQKKIVTEIASGRIIGHKYRILSLINSGGSGSIFLCHPLNDASVRYVLKVLAHPSPTSRKRFLREAQILSSITGNSRIANIIDYWEEGEDTFIVMEYISGKNLKQLSCKCALGEENVLIIAYEVTRALQDIWNKFSIVHRDIKPENIMIDDDGYIKLLDFGLSKRCDDGGNSTITIVSTTLGTPGYMSPEHFKDFRHIDFRSDIYSLGATLFFLLTSNKIAACHKVSDFYEHMVKNSPPPKEAFDNKCSAGCMKLIRRMMEFNPMNRHQSYDELLEEINSLLNG